MNASPATRDRQKTELSIRIAIWICVPVAFCLVIAGAAAAWYGHSVFFGINRPVMAHQDANPLNDMANFGSYLQGTTASLWSLAGFFIILVAFLAQKQQLIRQEQDLEEQRQEFLVQQESLGRQDFETFFFQLLSLLNQLATQMRDRVQDGSGGHHWQEGRPCFETWYKTLAGSYSAQMQSSNANQPRESKELDEHSVKILPQLYEDFYKHRQQDLGHYFRTLYHLIKFVKISDVVTEYRDKRRYTSLVRAQLSAYELTLLFYNCLSKYGAEFKPWIEEFGLLEHLDAEKLLHPKHVHLYDSKAFQ